MIILYDSDINFQRERNKNCLKCINIKWLKHYASVAEGLYVDEKVQIKPLKYQNKTKK